MEENKYTAWYGWEFSVAHDVRGYPTFYINGLSGDQKRDANDLESARCLIAAAPEMFEALEQLLGNAELARFHLQATEEEMIVRSALFDTILQARAALAKAKGASE